MRIKICFQNLAFCYSEFSLFLIAYNVRILNGPGFISFVLLEYPIIKKGDVELCILA